VDLSAALHDYALEWTADPATGRPKAMKWMVDGVTFHEANLDVSWVTSAASPYTEKGQPWDQRFHLILNGGGALFFGGEGVLPGVPLSIAPFWRSCS
jgi:hypothetical protein